jgi:flagellar biosynthetic protein FliO
VVGMTENFLAMMLQSLAGLAAVLALFAGLVWLVRRFQGSSIQTHGGQMKIMQRLSLDTKHSLVEVACGENRYIIGLSPSGMTSIAQSIQEEEPTMQTADT